MILCNSYPSLQMGCGGRAVSFIKKQQAQFDYIDFWIIKFYDTLLA